MFQGKSLSRLRALGDHAMRRDLAPHVRVCVCVSMSSEMKRLHYSNDHTNVYFALFHLKIVLLFERDGIFRRWNEAKTKFCIKINLKEGVAC